MKIVGTRIILRDERRDGDDEDLFRWHNLEEWNYYDEPWKPFEPVSRDRFEEWRRRPRKPFPGTHTWQIDTAEGEHIGWVRHYWLDEQAGHAHLGVTLPEEETWGRGYGTEALRLLIDYMFREMKLKTVKTATWSGNKRMMRCAIKCGFNEVSREPHEAEFTVRDEPLELVKFSVTRSEWRARQKDEVCDD